MIEFKIQANIFLIACIFLSQTGLENKPCHLQNFSA